MRRVAVFITIVLFVLSSLTGCSLNGYRVLKKDGQYYLILDSRYDTSFNSPDVEVAVALPVISFDSLAEMKNDILTGTFTEEEMDKIGKMYFVPDNAETSRPLPDLDNLYEPTLPECYEAYDVLWNQNSYWFMTEDSTATTAICIFNFLSAESYQEEVNTCLLLIDARAEGVSVIPVGDTNYYVRERIYNSGGKCIYLYGSSCGQYFRVQITKYKEFPSTEFFASFGLKPYTG